MTGIHLGLALGLAACLGPDPEDGVAPSLTRRQASRDEDGTLRLRVLFDHADAQDGPGSIALRGHPRRDELSARLVVGVPVRERRWTGCQEAELRAGTARTTLPIRPEAVPMSGGRSFDAIHGQVPIPFLRLAVARGTLRVIACGRVVPVFGEDLAEVGKFLDAFDEIAAERTRPRRRPAPTHPSFPAPTHRAGGTPGNGARTA